MISDADCCDLCKASYDPTQTHIWDSWESGTNSNGVVYGIKRIADTDVIVFRGSDSFLDWRRDLDTWAYPFTHPGLGPVHAGFYAGMIDVWTKLKPKIGKAIVTGHSLGAARTCILTGLMRLDGFKPLARVNFGEPQPGFQQLADLILDTPGRAYCNGDDEGHDLITDVPYHIPPLAAYIHPTPLIKLRATPTPDFWSNLGIFGYHHIALYDQAIRSAPK